MITLVEYPKRSGKLMLALLFSLTLHAGIYIVYRAASLISLAMGLRGVEFVDEEYDRTILISFNKRLTYPPGYLGFRPPDKMASIDEVKKEEKRLARLEAARLKRERDRLEREREEARKREVEDLAKAEVSIKTAPAPTPTPPPKNDVYPGGFGKINTAPIKDQIQQLYDAKKAGKLVIPDGKLKVGVAGSINSDGTLANYRIIIPSGIKEVDNAALAILEAVSVSRALGPLQHLTSLSMILEVDKVAQLNVVGFTSNEQEARAIVDLAHAALLFAKLRKADDPAVMVMLNNLKVSRTGQRVQAVISVPRQTASDTLTKSLDKGQT
ncbi:MAG: hypothetical protein L0226_05185 [Acidobacteria bacterium]|nr:hypothetical protein [Acidobacteriota bacterium]